MRIPCTVRYVTVEGDFAPKVDAVRVCCTRCNGSADALGQGEGSVRLAFLKLRDTCPRQEENFYVDAKEVQMANKTRVRGLIDPTAPIPTPKRK